MSINTNNLLQAIDIVAESRVKRYQYDETIEAKVVSTSQKALGVYKVEYQNGKFDAYAQSGDSYYENEIVYVQIPKGDMTKQKFILGRKVDNKTENATYNFHFKQPFDNFVALQDLTYNNSATDAGYLANDPDDGEDGDTIATPLWSYHNEAENPPVLIETKLGLAADFRTLLGSYFPQSGIYGLRIDVAGKLKSTETTDAQKSQITYYFTNQDMYGNTYAFYAPIQQQLILDISDWLYLTDITIGFYQDHNFYDVQGQAIPYKIQNEPLVAGEEPTETKLPKNIFISNLKVALGVTTEEYKTDRVFLYTYDNMSYGHEIDETVSEYYQEYLSIKYNPEYTDAEKTTAIEELITRYKEIDGYKWLDTERTLQMAWVHIFEGKPLLINRMGDSEDNGPDTFTYWINKGAKINWYQYEYDCELENGLIGHAAGVNWKRLIDNENQSNITIVPDFTRAKDQFKVVVTLNQLPYQSQPLVFTNLATTIETETANSTDEIIFRFFRPDFNENGDLIIIEDNTLRDFFVYDENNNVLTDIHNHRYSDYWYYVQVWVRNNDNGQYAPMEYNAEDGTIAVEWNLEQEIQGTPRFSMISQFSQIDEYVEDSTNEFVNVISSVGNCGYMDDAAPEWNNFVRLITRKFKIQERLDLNYTRNTISAIIKRRNKMYYPSAELHFGPAGSMGSAYTIVLTQTAPTTQYMIPGQSFTITATLYEKGKGAVEGENLAHYYSWELLSPSEITVTNSGGESVGWENGSGGSSITGTLNNEVPPVFRVTVRGAADYPISATKGFSILKCPQGGGNNYEVSCPDRVEFKSDGTAPIAYMGAFNVLEIVNNTYTEIYPDWVLTQQYKNNDWEPCNPPNYLGLKEELVAINALKDYLGLLIYYHVDNQTDEIDWSSLTLTQTDNYQVNTYANLQVIIETAYTQEAVNDPIAAEYNKVNRMLTLGKLARQQHPDVICLTYRLNPYVRVTNASKPVLWYWDDEMPNYYTVISWQHNGYEYKQAIPFTRNVYSSSLLNSWNGELFIDEAQNAILAQMISAGTKDSRNRFSGVVMGDWADVADSSLDIPGLYGIKEGAQVFGLRTDGTGFIGKSSKGQIQFDGNYSLISNADKSMYINLDPVTYTIDPITGYKVSDHLGYSPYFLYAETHGDTINPNILNAVDAAAEWAETFINNNKNYFIVDPNNGILTSGGIIAKYGKIGNWRISSTGLYYKDNDHYMYLGADDTVNNNDIKYAIVAGTVSDNIIDKLFSVDWDGTLVARRGKIGYTSPWVISDDGLTQTNNFGTIFLGNAETDETLTDETYQGLPNQNAIKVNNEITNPNRLGPEALFDTNLKPKYGEFAIYAGGPAWEVSMPGGQYQFTWNSANKIRFGVRMDGTLYASQGRLGSWNVIDKLLYTGNLKNIVDNNGAPTNNYGFDGEFIVIDGDQGIINLNNAVILSKTGQVKLGVVDNYGYTTADIIIADYKFAGRGLARINAITDIQYSDQTENITMPDDSKNDQYRYYGMANKVTLGKQSITTHYTAATASEGSIVPTASMTIAKNETDGSGIVLVSGEIEETVTTTEENSEGIIETDSFTIQKPTVLLYPTVAFGSGYAYLGTTSNPWNIVGNTIECNTLNVSQGNLIAHNIFMRDGDQYDENGVETDPGKLYLVATQEWVRNQLNDVYAQIKSTGSGAQATAGKIITNLGELSTIFGSLMDLLGSVTFYGPTSQPLLKKDNNGTLTYYVNKITFPSTAFEVSASDEKEEISADAGAASTVEVEAEGISFDASDIVYTAAASTQSGTTPAVTVKQILERIDSNFLYDIYYRTSTNELELYRYFEGDNASVYKKISLEISHTHQVTFTNPTDSTGTVTCTIGNPIWPSSGGSGEGSEGGGNE